MSQKRCLVVVDANAYWTEELFKALVTDWDVLLVKPREIRDYMRRHTLNKFRGFIEEPAEGIRILHIPMPPRYTTDLWSLGKTLLARAICKAGGERPDLLAICFPDYLELFDKLEPKIAVYYNYDDYAAHWPDRAFELAAKETATIARADLSIFIAKYRVDRLAERLPHLAARLHHLPIGVTPAFMKSGDTIPPDPPLLQSIPHPRAGYIGALSYRFDFPFFAEVAASLSDVQFVLGGLPPQQGSGSSLWWGGVKRARALENVHFIGWVDHNDLGDHLASFDVLLMPYAACPFNDSACPAKLWDYLGTGLPIVANTNNPETLLWKDVVYVAERPSDFANLIEVALDEKRLVRETAAIRRLRVAQDHTWDKLAARLEELIAVRTKHSH
jgi:glycosyltransferase involved in cell wall biosynthesis